MNARNPRLRLGFEGGIAYVDDEGGEGTYHATSVRTVQGAATLDEAGIPVVDAN